MPNSQKYLNYGMAYFSFINEGDKLYSEILGSPLEDWYGVVREFRYVKSGLKYIDSTRDIIMVYPTKEKGAILSGNSYVLDLFYTNGGNYILN